MSLYDKELKVYADNGLRTAEDWLTQRREIVSGVKPCVETPNRGVTVALYSRAQTQPRAKSQRVRLPKTQGADASTVVIV